MRAAFLLVLLVLSQVGFAENFPSAGRKDAHVYVPSQYDKAKAWPVVVLLHGYIGNDKVVDSYFGFSKEVSKRGFILIAPNGKPNSQGLQYWNATDACCDFDHTGNDDVGYIRALLAEVGAKYNIDKSRVYAMGHSNGGFFAHRLACEPNSPFAAVVSLAGMTFVDSAKCKPTHPISILQIHALNDETVKYEGDPIGFQSMAPYPGAVATVNQWATTNRCRMGSVAGPVLKIVKDHNTETEQWKGCDGGVRVELWKIQGDKAPMLGSGHIPTLTPEFTPAVLDFLLGTR